MSKYSLTVTVYQPGAEEDLVEQLYTKDVDLEGETAEEAVESALVELELIKSELMDELGMGTFAA